ncbi:MAG: methionyl-tRNA formyltransferase [Planctomycetes bacterium]|nr:methionyl-tRNA formyltransferase [Planctomycetota bacterium]
MKIVFFGTPDEALPTLEALARSHHEVALVVSAPDSRKGRNHKTSLPSPVTERALKLGLDVLTTENVNSGEALDLIRAKGADVGVIVAYGRILKQPLIDIFHHGIFNLHFSILPAFRGASPVTMTIAAGQRETGVSVQRIVLKLDAGPLARQTIVSIDDEDTTGSLKKRLAFVGAQEMLDTLADIEEGKLELTEQDEEAATFAKTITKDMGDIIWDRDATAIVNCVRAMNPWPTAYTHFERGGKLERLIIHRAEVIEDTASASEPGTIIESASKELMVSTATSNVRLSVVQRPGKKPVTDREFLNGVRFEQGAKFVRQTQND